jgi:hypothetical protein
MQQPNKLHGFRLARHSCAQFAYFGHRHLSFGFATQNDKIILICQGSSPADGSARQMVYDAVHKLSLTSRLLRPEIIRSNLSDTRGPIS